MHVAHKISFHETSEKDLEERRDRFVDVKPIDGTQTHYHFYFPSEGAVDIRYLTCLCVPCRKEQWQACVNKGYVGVWKRQQLQTVRAAGVRKHNPQQSKRAHAIADSLTGEEAAVALYTSQPERAGECFWLMKPSKKTWCVAPNDEHTCPISKETFGPGERVLQGEYYQQVDDNLYELRSDLGVFSVPALMLRAGRAAEKIELELEDSGLQNRTRQFYRLSEDTATRIKDLVVNVFRDEETAE